MAEEIGFENGRNSNFEGLALLEKYHSITMVLIPWYFGAVYFTMVLSTMVLSTMVKYTAPKYHGTKYHVINTMVFWGGIFYRGTKYHGKIYFTVVLMVNIPLQNTMILYLVNHSIFGGAFYSGSVLLPLPGTVTKRYLVWYFYHCILLW